MADEKINWQIEIDGKGALGTLEAVKKSAKEIDLSNKTLGQLDLMMRSLMETHRMAKQTADAVRMESKARQDNLRLAEKQKQTEKDRADNAAKAARDERQAAIAGLRNVAIGAGLGGLAMAKGMASSGFADTLQGQQAEVYGQLLNRQVASIFAPLLEEKTKYVAQITSWLSGLKEPQRESIRQMTMLAGSLTTFGYVVPKVTNGLTALAGGSGIGKLVAGGGLGGAVAAGGVAGPLGMAVTGLVSLLASTKEGRESLADLAKSFEPVVTSLASVTKDLARVAAALPKGKAINETLDIIDRDTSRSFSKIAEWVKPLVAWIMQVDPKVAARTNVSNIFAGPSKQKESDNGLSPIPKGFEEIGRDYERIFESATKINLQEKQVSLTEESNRLLQQLVNGSQQGGIVGGASNAMLNAIGF